MLNFKINDLVIMHTCMEASTYKGKELKCTSDSFMSCSNDEVVFLEGVSGFFCCEFLKKVGTGEGVEPKALPPVKAQDKKRRSKFANIQETIKQLLLMHPGARDDDFALMALYAGKNYPEGIPTFTQVIIDMKAGKMPGWESVCRLRRKVQEHNPALRGEDYGRRKGMVDTVRQDMRDFGAPMEQGSFL